MRKMPQCHHHQKLDEQLKSCIISGNTLARKSDFIHFQSYREFQFSVLISRAISSFVPLNIIESY
jgi:hypothetical protein